ncbi:MAG: hypothetical protein KIH01_05320 [Candidatus Freyarchaeota archaeon]|nr:hypothetical protein [Candidatus Jordarchaeia archaeon]
MLVEILSVPFAVQRKNIFSPEDEDPIEVASAFLLIWRKVSGGELSSVSRFFFPVHLVPVDEENMVAVEATGSFSDVVFHFPSPLTLGELKVRRLESFVEILKTAVASARKAYSKPLKASIAGLVGGAISKELAERLKMVEQWKVNPAELVPGKVSLKAAAGHASSLILLTKGNLERIAESFRENIRLADEMLSFFREEIGRLEENAEREKEKLRREAQEEIDTERKRLDDEIKRIEASRFLESPPSTSSLSHYARKLEKAISDATSGGDPESTLEKIGAVISSLKEAVAAFSRVEREYLGYLNRRSQFEREKEHLKRKAENEFRKKEEGILRELEREIAKVDSEAERMRRLLSEAVRLRNDYEELFRRWLAQARGRGEANSVFLISASSFPGKPPVTVYVPFFVFRVVGGKDEVFLVPPVVVDSGGVNPSAPLEELVSVSLNEETMSAISSGLKKLNYLLNPEMANLFLRGISILAEAGVVKKREAEEVKSFYDQYLKPAF